MPTDVLVFLAAGIVAFVLVILVFRDEKRIAQQRVEQHNIRLVEPIYDWKRQGL